MSDPKPTVESTLNEREQKLLSSAFLCLKSAPDVDYEKLAGLVGMTNTRSASNAFSAIKKKLWPDGVPSAAAKTTTTPKKAAARKPKPTDTEATTAADADAADDDTLPSTPVPKTPAKRAPRKSKAKAADALASTEDAGSAADNNDDDDNAQPEPKPKKAVTPRKRKPAAVKKEADAEGEGGSSPVKKPRGKKAFKSEAEVAEEAEEEEAGLEPALLTPGGAASDVEMERDDADDQLMAEAGAVAVEGVVKNEVVDEHLV